MATWSMCSIQYSENIVRIKSTKEINLGWLESQYTDRIFDFRNEGGVFKPKIVPDKGGKVGNQYPLWDYTLKPFRLEPSLSAYIVAWQVIQFLLADGWEPFSGFYDVAGSLSAGSGNIAGTPEFLLRKLSNS